MNGFLRLLLVLTLGLSLVRCASTQSDGEAMDDSAAVEEEFDSIDQTADSGPAAPSDENLSLEDELNMAEGAPPAEEPALEPEAPVAETAPKDEFAEFEEKAPPAQSQAAAPSEEVIPPQVDTAIEAPPPEIIPEEAPPPMIVENPPPAQEAPAEAEKVAMIKNIKYKANDNGGTVVIDANAPLTFETRSNPETNQFIIEIPNAELPARLKRPFNTRDMKGGIGAIDAYQNKGSTTARIVVQLRAGVPEPTVQPEGNSLLIVQSGSADAGASVIASNSLPMGNAEKETSDSETGTEDSAKSSLMSSSSLEDFLSGNTQFYGKKISLEVSQMDVREVFNLISEESGINLVLSDDVKGSISLKLRQVPWDQALVVIMKARKLGYTRAGNVLRVAPLSDIKAEEDDTLKLASARKAQAPLEVRMLTVSYAKIDELVAQVRPFLSERGKVVGDVRTSAIVVSDLGEVIDRIAKLIVSIDVPPPQVLIEGKIVEATEQFQRQVGINWGASGQAGIFGYGSGGRPLRAQTGVSVTPSIGSAAALLNFQLGTLDVLGDLNATLALYEQQNSVKVLSSPRIVTLHNEAAEINQTQEIPLVRETVSTTGTTRTVDFKPVKLRLSVTPQITNDASVIMAVDVNRDFLTGVVDAATQANPVASRSAKTKVMVKNSQTAVIGGIYQSDQATGESRVPWAADMPLFGWLFKSRSNANTKNELLIFLTPRILGQADSQTIKPKDEGGGIE